eukprot:scaffold4562_cov255-Pinguiococcus_pyrenoidosus.AAC.6
MVKQTPPREKALGSARQWQNRHESLQVLLANGAASPLHHQGGGDRRDVRAVRPDCPGPRVRLQLGGEAGEGGGQRCAGSPVKDGQVQPGGLRACRTESISVVQRDGSIGAGAVLRARRQEALHRSGPCASELACGSAESHGLQLH